MDKIIRLAVLLREVKDIMDEIEKQDGEYRVIQCDANNVNDSISVLIGGNLDGFHVPYKREFTDGDKFQYEDSVSLGGVKFHTFANEGGRYAKLAV